jgi:isoleucyl-tRNA synthetase
MENNRLAMKVSSMGRAVRSQAGIKVRQPLSRLLVKLGSERQKRGLEHLATQVLEEVNVKELVIVDDIPVAEWPLASEGDLTVMLDTDITPELAAEGMAREIVRRLQMMRRSAGFDIADHIVTYYQGDDYIREVMGNEALVGYIRQETLSRELVRGGGSPDAFTESHKIAGHQLTLGVLRQSGD